MASNQCHDTINSQLWHGKCLCGYSEYGHYVGLSRVGGNGKYTIGCKEQSAVSQFYFAPGQSSHISEALSVLVLCFSKSRVTR